MGAVTTADGVTLICGVPPNAVPTVELYPNVPAVVNVCAENALPGAWEPESNRFMPLESVMLCGGPPVANTHRTVVAFLVVPVASAMPCCDGTGPLSCTIT